MQLWEVIKQIQRGNGRKLKYTTTPDWDNQFIETGYHNEIFFKNNIYTNRVEASFFDPILDWIKISDEAEIRSSFQNAIEHKGRVMLEDKYLEKVYNECLSMVGFGGDESQKEDLLLLEKYLKSEGEYDYVHFIMSTITPYCDSSLYKSIVTDAKWYLEDVE